MKEWKDNITDFYNRLTSLLKTLSHDVSILRHTIENEPEKWEEKVEGMTLAMISNHTSTGKAASDRFAIIKFIEGSNNVNVKKIIKYEDHIAELFE